MSKPWGGIGAWALEAERAEAEERERTEAEAEAATRPPVLAAGEPQQSFPSLKEAAATKSKKKKAVPRSLSEFNTGAYVGPGGGRRHPPSLEPRGLTHNEMLHLPTGPRERSAEELGQSRLGGGFGSYGYGASAGGLSGRRSYGGGFEEEQRRGPPARVSDLDQPSRADEADNWTANKKTFTPAASMDTGRQDRYNSIGSGSSSRADEVDNWSRGKQTLPSRYPSFGSEFRGSSGPSLSSDSEWRDRGGAGVPLPHNGEREGPRLVRDPPKGETGVSAEPARSRPSPFGAARPREEVLAEKGLDWRKIDSETALKKTTRPTSSHSSRPSSAQSSRPGSSGSQAAAAGGGGGGGEAEGAPKARQKMSPFGDARPREVLLEEQGKDWRKIDLELEHRRVDRPETAEEKLLKEEINHLKELKEMDGNLGGNSVKASAEEITSLYDQIVRKEKDLELLTRELDDKVRFQQRATSDIRPGSAAGRTAIFSDRQPSHTGISGDSRNKEFMERPQSHGGRRDTWVRPMDDKRGSQGIREGGFFGSRDMGRSKSRERW